MSLEFDDIQHILLTRAPAMNGRYEFLSFRSPDAGRAWLSGIMDTVLSAKAMSESVETDNRWVTVAFTFNGLRMLGVDEASLETFPEEFKQGMVARAQRGRAPAADFGHRRRGSIVDPRSRGDATLRSCARPLWLS